MAEENAASRPGLVALLRRHPILTVIFVVCIALGITLGVIYLPADWALARRVAGGFFAGAGVAIFLTVTRLFD